MKVVLQLAASTVLQEKVQPMGRRSRIVLVVLVFACALAMRLWAHSVTPKYPPGPADTHSPTSGAAGTPRPPSGLAVIQRVHSSPVDEEPQDTRTAEERSAVAQKIKFDIPVEVRWEEYSKTECKVEPGKTFEGDFAELLKRKGKGAASVLFPPEANMPLVLQPSDAVDWKLTEPLRMDVVPPLGGSIMLDRNVYGTLLSISKNDSFLSGSVIIDNGGLGKEITSKAFSTASICYDRWLATKRLKYRPHRADSIGNHCLWREYLRGEAHGFDVVCKFESLGLTCQSGELFDLDAALAALATCGSIKSN